MVRQPLLHARLAETEYLKTTRELSRISRKRAELERRVGVQASPKKGSDGPERGVIDHVQQVGEIVRQVQGEVVKYRQGEPARRPRTGTEFIRVGNSIINPANITNIRLTQEDVRVYFTGDEPVIMDKKSFQDLEKRLPIRGR